MTPERRKFIIASFIIHHILLRQVLLAPERFVSRQLSDQTLK